MMEYELLTIREVAATLRMNVSTIYRLVRLKELPAPIKLGPAATRWRAEELRDWLDSRPRSVGTDAAPAPTTGAQAA